MKKIIYSLFWVIALPVVFTACKEDVNELGPVPSASDVDFTFTPSTENDNILNFTSSSGFLKIWDFGNGKSAQGDNVKGTFPVKGTYTVTLTVYTSGGSASAKKTVEIAETDPTLLDIPVYNKLTGGNAKPEGKTWVIDSKYAGHFGLGPKASTGPEWYQAGANEKNGSGLYNDKYTFKLSEFSYIFDTGGDIYMNGGQAPNFPGSAPSPVGDYSAPYTAPANLKWSVSDDNKFITISSGGFIGYFTGVSTYEIMTLTDDEMFLKYYDNVNTDFAWYIRLIREGYERPVEPVKPKEYKIEDIHQDFDGNGNFDFTNDSQGSIVKYDNPAPVPINTSSKVGKYTKANGQGGEYANIQLPLSYKMDIRTRHVFKLKVFIPSYNDYTTTGAEDWQSYKTLQKQVSVKLQNSDLGGNAYTTQAEVKQTGLETDKWLELTFDFSGYSTRDDFDKVVIQIGGEAIFTGGIFFLDDVELLP
jgi:hypothetical protein